MPTPWTPVPILMYHAVEDAVRPPKYKHFYVLADEFAGQMRMLKRAGYAPITFKTLAAARAGTYSLPPKPVVLTFDDGYANLKTNVHPLLREMGFPYTVFLVSERVGKTNDWVVPDGYEATPLLTWADLREMQADGGVAFEAHTATHPETGGHSSPGRPAGNGRQQRRPGTGGCKRRSKRSATRMAVSMKPCWTWREKRATHRQ